MTGDLILGGTLIGCGVLGYIDLARGASRRSIDRVFSQMSTEGKPSSVLSSWLLGLSFVISTLLIAAGVISVGRGDSETALLSGSDHETLNVVGAITTVALGLAMLKYRDWLGRLAIVLHEESFGARLPAYREALPTILTAFACLWTAVSLVALALSVN